jgi:hypothetical protein
MSAPRRSVVRCALAILTAAAIAGCGSGGDGSSGAAAGATGGGAQAGDAPVLAGAASRDVTPPVGAPLGGFGGGTRRVIDSSTLMNNLAAAFGTPTKTPPGGYCTVFTPSTGKHDPIRAKAIVLERGGERFALLGLDAIGVSRRARDEIARRVAPLGIANDHLLVCATHTHSGPAGIADKLFWEIAAMDMLDGRLYEAFVEGAAGAVADAAGRLAPARVGWGVDAETTVQHNRRGQGVFDPDLTAIRIDRLDGTPVALAVNLAVHGICLSEYNMDFTADLMGYCEREVEAQLGAGALCVFLNGCEGDVSPNQGDWSGAEALGKTIAAHALQVAQGAAARATPSAPLAVAWEEFHFAEQPAIHLDKVTGTIPSSFGVSLGNLQTILGAATIPLDASWLNHDIPLQAIRIGDLCLVAVPGEALTTTGLGIKAGARGLGFAHAIVVGLSNDHLGYIADPIEYDRGGYEAFMTLFGRSEGPEITDGLLRVASKIKP